MTEHLPKDGLLTDVTDDDTTGLSAPVLANTQRKMSVADVYIAPDPEVMKRIEAESSGKITHFPSQEVDQESSTGEAIFSEAVMRPLIQELLTRYPDKNLALRAIMASVDGTQKNAMGPGSDILDVTDIVARGTEKDHEVFNVQGLPKDPDTALYGIKHVAAYAYKVPLALRFYTDPQPDTPQGFEDAVFPAIMVYDADALQSTPDDRFTATFREGVNPPDALLSAYVLDKPGETT